MIDDRQWARIFSDSQLRERYCRYVEQANGKIGALLEFDPTRDTGAPVHSADTMGERSRDAWEGFALPEEAASLRDMPFVVKDNIAVRGFLLTCASKILADWSPPYTATAVARLQAAGARVVGKANLDEFGMGSSTETSALARTVNPWDATRAPGGSSGGTAAAVAAGMAPFGLGSDTGGSVRQPAAFCGIYGLKPTYGVVSRYGLVAYASSLEAIGVMSRSLAHLRSAFFCMSGVDSRDQTTIPRRVENRESGYDSERCSIGVLRDLSGVDPSVLATYHQSGENFRALGHRVEVVELPLLEYLLPAYYTIASAEASSNLERYDGVRYGLSDGNISALRGKGFGRETKLRILAGAYVLREGFQERYYHHAQRIRTAICNALSDLFKRVGVLLLPVAPTVAFPIGDDSPDAHQQKLGDIFTVIANMTAIPALSFPAGLHSNLPVGLQIMAPLHNEERLFSLADEYRAYFESPAPPQFDPNFA